MLFDSRGIQSRFLTDDPAQAVNPLEIHLTLYSQIGYSLDIVTIYPPLCHKLLHHPQQFRHVARTTAVPLRSSNARPSTRATPPGGSITSGTNQTPVCAASASLKAFSSRCLRREHCMNLLYVVVSFLFTEHLHRTASAVLTVVLQCKRVIYSGFFCHLVSVLIRHKC